LRRGAGGQVQARIDGADGDRHLARQAIALHLQELFHAVAQRFRRLPAGVLRLRQLWQGGKSEKECKRCFHGDRPLEYCHDSARSPDRSAD